MKDLMGMMKKVGEMQAKLKQVQEDLEKIEVEGQSGGGLVKVTLDGKGAMRKRDASIPRSPKPMKWRSSKISSSRPPATPRPRSMRPCSRRWPK